MHPRLLLQALLLTLVSGFPLPQRTTGFDLSALSSLFGRGSGTRSGAALPAFDLGSLLGGGAAGSGSDGAVSPLTAIPPQFPGSTSNDLVSGQPCKSNILLYSRGAMEGGNMGTSVGPSFQREIEKLAPGKFMFQGVNYDATYQWTLQLERVGGEISKKLIEEAVTKCPDARIFLGGYAHGGMVMHDAVNGTTAANKAKIAVSISRSVCKKGLVWESAITT